jgi:hypothetical protein
MELVEGEVSAQIDRKEYLEVVVEEEVDSEETDEGEDMAKLVKSRKVT